MQNKTIAIYSGEVPSNTFIERLILGLSSNTTIFLFGKQNKNVNYPNSIQLYTYSNEFSKFLYLLKYSFLLTIFKPKEKKKLDNIIAFQKGNKKIKKLKYYPVLYHMPTIFHLQWAKSIDDWLWVKEFGIKIALSLRGTHVSISPIADKALKEKYINNFHKVDAFHAVSKAILNEGRNYEPNLKNPTVIYSGLDLENLDFKPKTKINSPLKIVSIGRSHWLKGYHYALDAFAILKQQNFNFNYTIIGIKNDEELLFQRNQLGLDNVVNFQNPLPFPQIKEQIYQADILLLPSIEEGIANVVLEAMALGTLVISTSCGGMAEIVTDNENGFLIPIRSSYAIANAIKKVNSLSIKNYNHITLNARASVKNQHSKDKMISDFNIFYEKIIKLT